MTRERFVLRLRKTNKAVQGTHYWKVVHIDILRGYACEATELMFNRLVKKDEAKVESITPPSRWRNSHAIRRSHNLNQLVAPGQIKSCVFIFIEYVCCGEEK